MADHAVEQPRRYARVAGLMYIVTMALGIFSVNVVGSSLVVPGNNAATLNNISGHEGLFRAAVAGEFLMYLLVILLAFLLYVVLKPVDRNLAMLALLWRTGEAIIGGAVTILSGLVPAWLVSNESEFASEQLLPLLHMFIDLRSIGLDVVLIFIGVGGTLFSLLFLKSGLVPKILAAWGILTYLTMLVLSFTSILTPLSESTKMIFYTPGGIFELTFGLWLLIKGVDTKRAMLVS